MSVFKVTSTSLIVYPVLFTCWPIPYLTYLVPCCSREMEVFAVNHAFPFSKMLTFYRKEPFSLEASYGKNVNLPLEDGFIGKLLVFLHEVL